MEALNIFLASAALLLGVVGGGEVAGLGGCLIALAVWFMVLWYKD